MTDFASIGIDFDARALKKGEEALRQVEAQALRSAGATVRQEQAFRDVSVAAGKARGQLEEFAGVVGVIGLAALAKQAITLSDAYSQMNSKLVIATGSQEAANKALEATFQIAQQTRTSFQETANLYGKLAQSTEGLGISQERLQGITKTVNQAITLSGASAASAQAALVQFGQGLASGTLRGEELNSILEQTPGLAKALADGLGIGIGQLRALGAEGKITADKIVEALENVAESVDKKFGKVQLTVSQSFVVLENQITKSVGEIDKATGASNGLADAIVGVSTEVGKLTPDIIAFVQKFDGFLVGGAVGLGLSAIAGILLTIATRLNPIVAGITLLASAIGQIDAASKKAQESSAVLNKLFDEEARLLKEIKEKGEGATNTFLGMSAGGKTLGQQLEAVRGNIANYADSVFDAAEPTIQLGDAIEDVGNKAGGTAPKVDKAIESIISSLQKQNLVLAETIKKGSELTDSEKKRLELSIQLGGQIPKNIELLLDEADALNKKIEVQKEEIALIKMRAELAAKEVRDFGNSARKGAEDAEQRNRQIEDEIARLGLKSEALAELEARTLSLRAAELRAEAEKLGGAQSGDAAEEMLREAVALEKQIALVREKSAKEVALAQIEENNRVAKQFEDDLIDAFEEAFLRGGDFAKSFSRAIEAQFAKMVLRPAIEAVIRGNNPVDALAGSPAAVSSLQAFSNFSNGGIGGVALGGFLSSAESIGANAILNGYTELGSKIVSVSATLGKVAPYAGSIVQLLQGDVRGAAGSAAGTAIGTAIGNAILPGVGGAIGAALGGLVGGSLVGGNKISATNIDQADLQPITDTITNSFNGIIATLGGTSQATFSTTANTGRQGENPVFVVRSFANGQNGRFDTPFSSAATSAGGAESRELALNDANIAEQTTRAIVAALKLSDFADNIDAVIASLDPFNSSLKELETGLQNAQILAVLNEQFKNLEGALGTLSGASIETIGGFLQLVGGLEGLQAGFDSFYSAFYTEQQKTERLTKQVTDAFAQFGQAVPTSRDELVKLVDGLNLQDESQAKLLATVFQLTPALDQLLPAFDGVRQSAESVASAYARLTSVQMTNEQVAQQRIQLENELFALTATSAQQIERQRSAIDASNRAIFDQIQAEKARQEAEILARDRAEKAKIEIEAQMERDRAAAQAVMQERQSLETRILQLSGDTVAIRQRELAAINPVNRALLEQIFALEDAQKAQQAFAQQVSQTEQSLSAATSRLSAAQSAVQAAQSAVDAVRTRATDDYLTAQERVIAAQTRLNDLQGESARRIRQVSGSLTEFLRGLRNERLATQNPEQLRNDLLSQFQSNQALALSGDAVAAERAQGLASELLNASKAFFASSGGFQADLDLVTTELQKLIGAGGAESEANPLVAAQNELAAAQKSLADATVVANTVGASLVRSQESLIEAFNKATAELTQALIAQAGAQAEVTVVQQQLDALKGINSAVSTLQDSVLASLGEVGASIVNSLNGGFALIDTDSSEGISPAEFAQAFASLGLGEKLDQIFSAIDVNGNGLIDKTEALRAQTALLNTTTATSATQTQSTLGSIQSSSLGTLDATGALQRFFEQTIAFGGNGLAVSLAQNQNTNAVNGLAGASATALLTKVIENGGLLVRSNTNDEANPIRFANGGVFSNSIVSSPTRFAIGEMGEAGPEAVMPLTRAPDGSLGVRGGQSMSSVVNELRVSNQQLRSMNEEFALSNRELRALVRVQQAGNSRIIEQLEDSNETMAEMGSKSRLEMAK